MIYGSVCSGIEAASTAWEPLGWQPEFFSEIEKFPSAVLNYHWPKVPNLGDMTKFQEWNHGSIDLLVGGTPCQSFSVAGLRKGLDDPRGNLMLTFGAIAKHARPTWLVWENVPGVLSANGGRDFGTFLGMLAELGYGFAYRVLDAQYFGVAQRRRRVFVVGYLGDWRRAGAVLFERHSLSGDIKPSREAREEATGNTLPSSIHENQRAELTLNDSFSAVNTGGGKPGQGYPAVLCDNSQKWPADVASTLNDAFGSKLGLENQHINGGAPLFVPGKPLVVHGTQDPIVSDKAHALGRNQRRENVVFPIHDKATRHAGKTGKGSGNGLGIGNENDPAHTLTTGDHHAVFSGSIRRLTPIECERLQGFPDNHTAIPWRGKLAGQCPDSPRYKAIGNSMAVPVMRWIGERIEMVDKL